MELFKISNITLIPPTKVQDRFSFMEEIPILEMFNARNDLCVYFHYGKSRPKMEDLKDKY